MAEFLIKNGAEIKKQKNEENILHLGARYNKLNCIKYGISHSLDINKQNLDGDTPLHVAI